VSLSKKNNITSTVLSKPRKKEREKRRNPRIKRKRRLKSKLRLRQSPLKSPPSRKRSPNQLCKLKPPRTKANNNKKSNSQRKSLRKSPRKK